MDGAADGSTAAPEMKKDDSLIALGILVAAGLIVIFLAINYFRSKGKSGNSSWKQNSFTPPPERQNYLTAKETLNSQDPMQRDELKKLLMKRALHTIPHIVLLQSEGTSIDRLYKKGMLTDDMHYKAKELRAFVDQEVQDVQAEADELAEGWGQMIWPQAMQYHRALQMRTQDKAEELKGAEESKKKSDAAKKKEKERAKKLAALKEIGEGAQELGGVKGRETTAGSETPSTETIQPTQVKVEEEDPELVIQQLAEEFESEANKAKNNQTSSSKNKKKSKK